MPPTQLILHLIFFGKIRGKGEVDIRELILNHCTRKSINYPKIDEWRNLRESMLFSNINVNTRDNNEGVETMKELSLGAWGTVVFIIKHITIRVCIYYLDKDKMS